MKIMSSLSPFPIDQTVVTTSFPIRSELGSCPLNNLGSLPPEIRRSVFHIAADARLSERRSDYDYDGTMPDYDPDKETRRITLGRFKVITLYAAKLDCWRVESIRINPGKIVHGHNGRILTMPDFHRALSIAIELVKPLLANADDWRHVLPGIADRNRAYWRSLEIPFHIPDVDGRILKALHNAKHPSINSEPAFSKESETVTFSNSDRSLVIIGYRKDIEMKNRLPRFIDPAQCPIVRIEVRIKGQKLAALMPNATWSTIAGKRQLVRFGTDDLRHAFLRVVRQLKGFYSRVPSPSSKDDNDQRLGRMMGMVAADSGLSIDRMLDYYVRRFLSHKAAGTVRNTKCRLRKAARDEMSLLSPINFADIFSDDAWNHQPNLTALQLERKAVDRHEHIHTSPLVAAAYGRNPKP